ncbi:MAG: hypothetical protein ABI665_00755 [Vicinamibacterales bacterium]
MIDGIKGKIAQSKMLKQRRRSLAAMLVALSVVVSAPTPAHGDGGVNIEGTFSVVYAYPSAVNYCGDGAGENSVSIQAQGLGNIPGLGAMFLDVKKCLIDWTTYSGTFTMSAGNGHVLRGTYEGTQGPYNENGFSPFGGVMKVTGGTGRFRNMTGRLTFEAVSGPDAVGAIASTFNGTAFYRVRGTVSPGNR